MEGTSSGSLSFLDGKHDEPSPDGGTSEIRVDIEFQKNLTGLPGEGSVEPIRDEADNAFIDDGEDMRSLIRDDASKNCVGDGFLIELQVVLVDGLLVEELVKLHQLRKIIPRCEAEGDFFFQVSKGDWLVHRSATQRG